MRGSGRPLWEEHRGTHANAAAIVRWGKLRGRRRLIWATAGKVGDLATRAVSPGDRRQVSVCGRSGQAAAVGISYDPHRRALPPPGMPSIGRLGGTRDSDSVGFDRLDPQAIDALAVPVQEREDETLAGLLAPPQLAQPPPCLH